MSKRLSKRGSVKKALPLPTGRGRVHGWIEKWAALTEADREQVHAIAAAYVAGGNVKNMRYHLAMYKNVFVASKFVVRP
eukprot:gene14628-24536_t